MRRRRRVFHWPRDGGRSPKRIPSGVHMIPLRWPHRHGLRETWPARGRNPTPRSVTESAGTPTVVGPTSTFLDSDGNVAQDSSRCHLDVRVRGHNLGEGQRDRRTPRCNAHGRPTLQVGSGTASSRQSHLRRGCEPPPVPSIRRNHRRGTRAPGPSAGTATDPIRLFSGTGTGPGGWRRSIPIFPWPSLPSRRHRAPQRHKHQPHRHRHRAPHRHRHRHQHQHR